MSLSLFYKRISVISFNLTNYLAQSCSDSLKKKAHPLFKCSQYMYLSSATDSLKKEEKSKECKITFIKKDGEKITVTGKTGDTLLDVVVDNNLDFGGFGACEGTLTCSTCHVILKKEDYDRLPNEPGEEETDMLDLAYELTDTSRLGCQIELTKDLDGLEVKLPTTINDARN